VFHVQFCKAAIAAGAKRAVISTKSTDTDLLFLCYTLPTLLFLQHFISGTVTLRYFFRCIATDHFLVAVIDCIIALVFCSESRLA
jgi:hypothetical protein